LSKNDLNASQKKILEIIVDSSTSSSAKDSEGFDFPCLNDYCSGRTPDSRVNGIAWKNKSHYEVFCYTCGCSEKITKEELKEFKNKVGKETHELNSIKEKEEKKARKKRLKELEELEDMLLEEQYKETSDE
jgi:hypothetical protein